MVIAYGTVRNACSDMATSPTCAGGSAAAIADLVGYLAADDGRLLQYCKLLSPILPVNVCPRHLRSLRHRCRRDVARLPALRLAGWLLPLALLLTALEQI